MSDTLSLISPREWRSPGSTLTGWSHDSALKNFRGLDDQFSRLHTSRTQRARKMRILGAQQRLRDGPLRIDTVTGTPARTVSRILTRHEIAPLA